MELSSPPTWRRDFYGMLADLADDLLPPSADPALRSGAGIDAERLWAAHTMLDPLPPASEAVTSATELIVDSARERGLLDGVSAEDLFLLLLGRLPIREEPSAAKLPLPVTLSTILRSPEFTRALPSIAKSVISRGQWNYFIHIPKTAGSQFQAMLWTQFGPASVSRSFPDDDRGVSHPWVAAAWLRRLLHDHPSTVWVSGHLTLDEIRPTHAAWPTDRVVTLVRNPVEQAISTVNYYYGLRESQPESTTRYFTAMLGVEAAQDLDSLDLEQAVIRAAGNDIRLRPSFFFNGDVLSAVLRQRVIVGFQETVLPTLELVAGEGGVHLPHDVMHNSVRLNPSATQIDADSLGPGALAETARACSSAVVDYFALRTLAAGKPYVNIRG